MKKALAITVCDRVEYFKKMARSLAIIDNLSDYDIFFFIDANGKKHIDTYHSILNAFGIINYHFEVSNINLGCCSNIIRSRQVLFDYYNYDFVVYSDDDVIFARSFLNTHTNLLNWASENYDNIGTISVWNNWPLTKKEKLDQLPLVYGNTNTSMTCAMTRECWNDISDEIMKFNVTCTLKTINGDYHQCIEYLYNRYKEIKPSRTFERSAVPFFEWYNNIEANKDKLPASQDMMFPIALNKKGWCGLTTVVNRCLTIGVVGVHTDAERWDTVYQYKHVILDEFKEDTIKDFILYKR